MATSHNFNEFVNCPYNRTHSVLRGRLTTHLDRCSRNFENTNQLLICPFNETHRYNAKLLRAHIKDCPDHNGQKTFKMKDVLPAVSVPPRPVLVECEEDWDNEPDVPTYDPNAYCQQNLVIRSSAMNGLSKAERRNFRDNERRRFAEKQ